MKKGIIVFNGYYTPKAMTDQIDFYAKEFASFGAIAECIPSYNVCVSISRDGLLHADVDKNDFVLFLDKDVKLARLLELAGFRLFNRSRAIEICDDKFLTHTELVNRGIRMPKTISAPLVYSTADDRNNVFLTHVTSSMSFPMVVKESFGSYGKQVYLIHNEEELHAIRNKLSHVPHLYQEYVSESCGRDARLFCVGGKVVASMARENRNDFRANLSNGGVAHPFDPPYEFKDMAEKVSKAIGLDYCGIDILFGKDGPVFCEANSNAHFMNANVITGKNIAREYVRHILASV